MPRLSKIGAAALAAFGWTGLSTVSASYLVVAGGGGGGSPGVRTGGGGAGGYRTGSLSLNITQSYTVTVGAGGSAGAAGSNSVFSTITSTGGGNGGTFNNVAGATGGSGGGGGGGSTGAAGGAGTSGQGSAGGTGSTSANSGAGGGGGGASAVGGNASGDTGGTGGAGTASSISGSSVTYAGGGGGGAVTTAGSGGAGGGGAGSTSGTATAGTANLGGGGGGTGTGTNAAGGSGIVIISYPAPQKFGGGIVTTSGSNVIHTFNTSGTLTSLSSLTASYLIVAGGGGTTGTRGGGGGGGGMLAGSGLTIDTNSNYVVVVGAGGAGGAGNTDTPTSSQDGTGSSFSAYNTSATGGGSGGGAAVNGRNGGSGGGGGASSTTAGSGGTGNTPSTTPSQGTNGGTAVAYSLGSYGAGGGGGGGGSSGVAGSSASGTTAGNGGNGTQSSISGTATYYAGGGGGGGGNAANSSGGSGGGGAGAYGAGLPSTQVAGTNGTANLGGGGGGGSNYAVTAVTQASGGSGVVIISYAGSTQQMAGGTVTISGGNVIHTFTSSGYLTPIKYVNNSLRFRSSASAYLSRTPASAGNRTKWTWSGWVKRGVIGGANNQVLFGSYASANDYAVLQFRTTDDFDVQFGLSGTAYRITSSAVYRDPSAWYHVVVIVDTTQATAADRMKMYVNGVQVTAFSLTNYPAQNFVTTINSTTPQNLGQQGNSASYFDGYLTEINWIDGQALTPNSFGTFNSYGVWQPITYGGSYGTNGFYLPFTNTTSTTTLGYDFSPNGNNWTTNNISLTAGSTYDSMTDVPTLTSATAANYCVGNPLDNSGTLSSGNLTFVSGGSNQSNRATFQLPSSGKFYAECTLGTTTSASVGEAFGYATASASLTGTPSSSGKYVIYADSVGYIFSNGSTLTSSLGTFASGTVLQIAYDGTTGNAWVGKNNIWYNSSGGTTGDPSAGSNPTFTSLTSVFPFTQGVNGTQNLNFGQQSFTYTPPTGFVALNTYNL